MGLEKLYENLCPINQKQYHLSLEELLIHNASVAKSVLAREIRSATNLNPNCKLSQGEIAKHLEKLSEQATGFLPNYLVGKAVLSLVSDWGWMHRRVEQIKILSNGQTRRQLSFDFSLPYNEGLYWNHSTSEVQKNNQLLDRHQVCIPLTFFRKGPLVNLDIQNGEGNSVPSAGLRDNGYLSYQALRILAEELRLGARAREHLGKISDDTSDAQWQRIVNLGISHVVLSADYDESAVSFRDFDRLQEVSRHDAFASLAQLASLVYQAVNGQNSPPADVEFSPWILDLDLKSAHDRCRYNFQGAEEIGGFEKLAAFDSSFAVHVLATTILAVIREEWLNSREAGHEPSDRILKKVELLSVLLSVTSTSYLFTIIADASLCWTEADPIGHSRRAASLRQIVKVGCDVETYNDNFGKMATGLKGEIASALNMKSATSFDTIVRYSTSSAQSTHLEFSYPSDMRGFEVLAVPPRDGIEKGPDTRRSPMVYRVGVERVGVEKHSAVSVEGNRSAKVYRHGTFKASQDRVHVSSTRGAIQPVDALIIRLVPEKKAQPLLALGVSIVSLLYTFWTLVMPVGQSTASDFYPTWGDFLALETLLTGLFGALFITAEKHHIVRNAFSLQRGVIAVSAAIGIVSPILINIAWYLIQVSGSDLPRRLALIPLLILFLLWLLVAWNGSRQWKAAENDPRGLFSQKVIRYSGYVPPSFHERSVVAITETGAYDCDYLHEDVLSSMGYSLSSKEYIRDLGLIGKGD